MFENIVSTVLNKVLGEFIDDVSSKNLNIGIWGGDVVLEKISVKKQALDKLNLPIDVKQGFLGKLVLKIPWKNLSSAPVQVILEDVFVVASPKFERQYNQGEETEADYASKQKKLKELEEAKKQAATEASEAKDADFTTKLVAKIIDNLQVQIGKVHVRFEDTQSDPKHPFAMGVTLGGIAILSTDQNWKTGFVHETTGVLHKILNLDSLAVYMHTDAAPMSHLSQAEFLSLATKMVHTSSQTLTLDHQYILKPLSGGLKLRLDLKPVPPKNSPKAFADLFFEEIGVALDDSQYQTFFQLLDIFSNYSRKERYRKFRPIMSVKGHAKRWWKFANDSILFEIRAKTEKWTWKFFANRRNQRKSYIQHFKALKLNPKADASKKILADLEKEISLNDIVFYRSIAEAEFAKENPKFGKKSKLASFFSFGGDKNKSAKDELTLTDEEKKELYKTIEFDDAAVVKKVELPKDYEQLVVKFHLKEATVSVRNSSVHQTTKKREFQPIMDLSLTALNVDFKMRPNSFDTAVTIHGLRVSDKKTVGTRYPHLIDSKNTGTQGNLFSLAMKHNPLDGHADEEIKLKLEPLEVVVGHAIIAEIAKFFIPPKKSDKALDDLSAAAGSNFAKMTSGTRAGLEHALTTRKRLDLSIDIDAPLILVPQNSLHENSFLVAMDLGRIVLNSTPVSLEKQVELARLQGTVLTDQKKEELESLAYDRYLIAVSSLQVLLGHSLPEVQQLVYSNKISPAHLLHPISLNVSVEKCILTNTYEYADLKVVGTLPIIDVNVSDKKIAQLAKLGKVAAASFSILSVPEEEDEALIEDLSESDLFSRPLFSTDKPSLSELEARILGSDNDDDEDIDNDGSKDVFFDAKESLSTPNVSESQVSRPDDAHRMLQSIQVQALFALGKISVTLVNEGTSLSVSKLLTLSLEELGVKFTKRTFDLALDCSLGKLTVNNWVNQKGNLIESDPDSFDPFVHFKFTKVEKHSPEFLSVYKGNDLNLVASLGLLSAKVDPQSILTVVSFLKFMGKDLSSELAALSLPAPTPDTAPADSKPSEKPTSVAKLPSAPAKGQAPPPPAIHVVASIRGIVLLLLDDEGTLLEARLRAVNADVLLEGPSIRVTGGLQAIEVLCRAPPAGKEQSLFNSLVETTSSEGLIQFAFSSFDKASATYPGYDMSVKLKMQPLTVTYIHPAILDLMAFGKRFQEIQGMIDAAARAASEQLDMVTESAAAASATTKFHFDVNIHAPVLRVIRSRYSREIVIVDLGELKASNKFTLASDGVSEIDEISVSLNAVHAKLGYTRRKIVSGDQMQEIHSEEVLLANLDVGVGVRRCLSSSVTTIPQIEISGGMSALEVIISDAKIGFLLSVAQVFDFSSPGGEKAPAKVAPKEPTPAKGERARSKSVKSAKSGKSGKSTSAVSNLDLFFSVAAVRLTIEKELETRGEDAPLGFVSLNAIEARVVMLSDSSLLAEVSMQSLVSRDCRPTSKNFYKEAINTKPLILSVSLLPEEKKTVVGMSLSNPTISLIFDFWLEFADTLLLPLKHQQQAATSTKEKAPAPATQKALPPAAELEQPEKPAVVELVLNVYSPVVKLYGDPTNEKCDGLTLGIDQVYVSMKGPELALKVQQIQIRSCRMDQLEVSTLPFLAPFDVAAAIVTKPDLQSIELKLGHLGLEISYRDIKVLLQISSTATTAIGKTQFLQPPPKVAPEESDQFKKISYGAESSMSSILIEGAQAPKESGLQQPKKETLSLILGGIDLLVVNDCGFVNVPFVSGKFSPTQLSIFNWSSQLSLELELAFNLDFFNSKISVWEPLIEPYSLHATVSKAAQQKGPLSLKMRSDRRLEVTLSYTFLQIALSTTNLWLSDLWVYNTSAMEREAHSPFEIRNDLGLPIKFWSSNTNTPETHLLDFGEKKKWTPEKIDFGTSQCLSVQIIGGLFGTLTDIPIDHIGLHLITLRPSFQGIDYRLVCDVSWLDGSKLVTIRSSALLTNKTTQPIDLNVTLHHNSPWDLKTIAAHLDPEKSFSIPLPLCYHGQVFVKPQFLGKSDEFKFSSGPLFWPELLGKTDVVLQCNSKDNAKVAHFKISGTENGLSEDYLPQLKLSAPIVVSNILPVPITVSIEASQKKETESKPIPSGEESEFFLVSMSPETVVSISIPDMGYKTEVPVKLNQPTITVVNPQTKLPMVLKLSSQSDPITGTFELSVFSPYMFLDQSGLNLVFKQHQRFGRNAIESATELSSETETNLLTSKSPEGAVMTLFSYTQFEPFKSRALIRAPNSDWSKPISLEATGSAGEVVMNVDGSVERYQLGVVMGLGEGKFYRTKVIKLAPRYMVVNETGEPATVTQVSVDPGVKESGTSITLDDKQASPLHFQNQKSPKRALKLSLGEGHWTSPFLVDDVGEFDLQLYSEKRKRSIIIRVYVMLSGATLFVTLTRYGGPAPYRIENHTSQTFKFRQLENSAQADCIVEPKTGLPFVWSPPNSPNKKLLISLGKHERAVDMKTPGQTINFVYTTEANEKKAVSLKVFLESSTVVLRIVNSKPPAENFRLLKRVTQPNLSSSSVQQEESVDFEEVALERIEAISVELDFKGIGLSLVDKTPQELLYLSIQDFHLEFSDSNLDQSVTLSIDKIQLDDQTPNSEFAVVICQTPIDAKKLERDEIGKRHNLYLSLKKLKALENAKGVEAFEYFTFLLQEMDIEISELFLFQIIRFTQVFNPPKGKTAEQKIVTVRTKYPPLPQKLTATGKFYFGVFELQPIKLNITFTRAKDDNLDDVQQSSNALKLVLDVLSNTVGSIDGAPIQLNALEIQHLLADFNVLVHLISVHYATQAVSQLHKIVGSVEILGNPVGLFNNISTGVEDFFYEPYKGLSRGPADFAKGMGVGTASLLKNSAAGLLEATSKITGSVGKGLAEATMDEKFQAERRARRRQKNKSILDGFGAGAASVGMGLAGGVTGLITKPMEGAKASGAKGFFSGLGKGVVGVVTKPIVGLFDGASQIAEGVGGQITAFDGDEVTKVRLARFIDVNSAYSTYSAKAAHRAVGALFKGLLQNLKKSPELVNLTCIESYDVPSQGTCLLVTEKYLIMLSLKKLAPEWFESLLDLRKIKSERENVKLDFADLKKDSTKSRSVFCPDQSTMAWLEKAISDASLLAEQRAKMKTIVHSD